MTASIELATGADCDSLAALINAAYRVEDFFKVGDRTDSAEIRQLMEQQHFFVVRDEDEGANNPLRGCVYVAIDGTGGYFGMLSVRPGGQGRGLGRSLVTFAEDYCRANGCTDMDLIVVNLRDDLRPWYERLGYRTVGEEPWPEDQLHRVSKPVHFVRMSKPLIDSDRANPVGQSPSALKER